MQVHLFGSAGEPPLQNIVDVSFAALSNHSNPVVLYLPPTFRDKHAELTRQKFKDLAEVNAVDLSKVSRDMLERALEGASFLCIPGGNTYLLNFCLHQLGVVGKMITCIKSGLAYAGISAGALICGANILTTSDINCCGATDFSGLGLTEYNFVAHYPDVELERETVDDRISAYHLFHKNPVIALNGETQILITENGLSIRSGSGWLFRKGKAKVQINCGDPL